MTDQATLALEQQRIDLLFKRIDDAYDRASRAAGISPSVSDILYALHGNEGLTQKQICDLSYTGKQTINSAIHKMERDGLLYFEPGHGRSLKVYLTDAGRQLADRAILPVKQAEYAALNLFTDEERAQAFAAMNRYADELVNRLDRIGSTAASGEKPTNR